MRIHAVFCTLLLASQTCHALDLRLTPVLGTTGVVEVTNAHDGSGRLFLVQQDGHIRIARNGQLLAQPFVDLSGVILSGSERGLLGLAFAPDYAGSGRFYVYYTATDGAVTIARMRVSGASPDLADAASREVLLSIPHADYGNHNGGKLAFGPDGYLYAGVGDGGGGGDPLGSGQNLGSLLAKLLRIDVAPATGYAIPTSNPFRGAAGAKPEIWAYGLRNPWRFSFDRQNGDLYIGDVGQDTTEEVDFLAAGSAGGQNYGWNVCEGDANYAGNCQSATLTAPVATYKHTLGCSITGGYVYRGSTYAALNGVYLYGDYCSGRIWGLSRSGSTFQSTQLASSGLSITTFGEGESGNLYVVDPNKGVYLISDGAPHRAITAAFTGSWYDPAQSGHGVMFEVLSDTSAVAVWYTFAPSGGQAWFGGAGTISNGQALINAVQTTGGKFIPNFDPSAIQKPDWGTLTLTFSDCNTGRVDFSSVLGYGTGSMNLKRLTGISGATCSDSY
ncbi:MAG: PQQ-dependent sugar dehydrogenase [Rudaea sp.]